MRPLRKLLTCALIVALAGCERGKSPRDLSNVLIGHWESIDGEEQYYISPTEVTFYFAEDDRLGTHKYIILQQYPKSRTIEIRVQTQGSVDFKDINDRKIVLSADYKMAETYYKRDATKFLGISDPRPPEYSQTSSWRYVDDKQKP